MTARQWLWAMLVVFAGVWSGDADAHDAARQGRTHGLSVDPSARPRTIYRGRMLSYAAWTSMAAGAVVTPVGFSLNIYDYRGEPFEKWKYDRAFLQRQPFATPLGVTGLTLVGAHFPLLMTGVLLEGGGLRRVTGLSVVPGWVGFSLVLTGAALSIPFSPVMLVVGPTIAVAGYACVLAQFGMNVRASRRWLQPEVHDELYRPRSKVVVGAAPMWVRGGGGASFVMSF